MTRPIDHRAIEATWRKTRASVVEYAVAPSTTGGYLSAPCVRGCGRNVRTNRGVCRWCSNRKGES